MPENEHTHGTGIHSGLNSSSLMKSTFFLAAFFFLSIFSAMAQMVGVFKPGDRIVIQMEAPAGAAPSPATTYAISSEGTTQLLKLEKSISVVGTPPWRLTKLINEAYKNSGIVPAPTVKAIYMGPPEPLPVILVGGAVKDSGEFPLRKGMTLMRAINRAGGFNESADPSRVKLIRANQETIYDLREIKADDSNNPVLMDGDQIVVPALTEKPAAAGLLKPGDSVVLRVKSADNEILEVATAYPISDHGMIRMPMLGKEIPATGISPSDLTIKINEAYKAAGVSAVVELADRESTICNQVITISGGVTKPGEYLLRPGMTVFAAISRAGGFSDGFSSKVKKVKILRDQKELIFDLRKINPDGSNNPVLMDGDEVIVPAG